MPALKKMYAVKHLFNGGIRLNFFFVHTQALSQESAWALVCGEYDVPITQGQSLIEAARTMGIAGVQILPEI